MRFLLVVLLTLSVHAAAVAKSPDGLKPGLYGNVRMSAQTGDLGGQEIRLFNDPETVKPMVEFVDCEGWCNATYVVPLMRDEQGYWFQYGEKLVDENGNAVSGETRRYRFTFKGKKLILSGTFPSCGDCEGMGPYKLKPLKSSFGIAVANNEP